MTASFVRRASLAAALSTLLVVGCSGGSSGLGSPSGNFLLGDAAVNNLLSFSATATSMRMRDSAGNFTANVLAAPVNLEYLSLQNVSAWVASSDVPSGTYDAIEVVFDGASVMAAAKDGSPVSVTVLSTTLLATLPAATTVSSGSLRFEVDLDLLTSLSGDVTTGAITFDPSGSTLIGDDTVAVPVDEFEGTVTSFDAGAGTLVVDSFAEADEALVLGSVTVNVASGILLLDKTGASFADATAFFAALVNGSTLLEVHGDIGAGGSVDATRIEVEDDGTGGGNVTLVRIEGTVLAVTPGLDFQLLIEDIEKGEAVADPVLTALGNPASITVSFDANTLFLTDAGVLSDQSALATGQDVKTKFAVFGTEPFPAFSVEYADLEPEFEGATVDVSGLPNTIVINLDATDPAVVTGEVDSATTNVSVDLSAGTLVLDSDAAPALVAGDLKTGMGLTVKGVLSGPSSGPSVAASQVEVSRGRLDTATVTGSDSVAGTFTTSGGTIKDPFGGAATSGPFSVTIEPACVFTGDVSTVAEFHAAVAALGAGDTMLANVDGLGTDQAGVIRAFEVEVAITTQTP